MACSLLLPRVHRLTLQPVFGITFQCEAAEGGLGSRRGFPNVSVSGGSDNRQLLKILIPESYLNILFFCHQLTSVIMLISTVNALIF